MINNSCAKLGIGYRLHKYRKNFHVLKNFSIYPHNVNKCLPLWDNRNKNKVKLCIKEKSLLTLAAH